MGQQSPVTGLTTVTTATVTNPQPCSPPTSSALPLVPGTPSPRTPHSPSVKDTWAVKGTSGAVSSQGAETEKPGPRHAPRGGEDALPGPRAAGAGTTVRQRGWDGNLDSPPAPLCLGHAQLGTEEAAGDAVPGGVALGTWQSVAGARMYLLAHLLEPWALPASLATCWLWASYTRAVRCPDGHAHPLLAGPWHSADFTWTTGSPPAAACACHFTAHLPAKWSSSKLA